MLGEFRRRRCNRCSGDDISTVGHIVGLGEEIQQRGRTLLGTVQRPRTRGQAGRERGRQRGKGARSRDGFEVVGEARLGRGDVISYGWWRDVLLLIFEAWHGSIQISPRPLIEFNGRRYISTIQRPMKPLNAYIIVFDRHQCGWSDALERLLDALLPAMNNPVLACTKQAVRTVQRVTPADRRHLSKVSSDSIGTSRLQCVKDKGCIFHGATCEVSTIRAYGHPNEIGAGLHGITSKAADGIGTERSRRVPVDHVIRVQPVNRATIRIDTQRGEGPLPGRLQARRALNSFCWSWESINAPLVPDIPDPNRTKRMNN